MNNKLTDDRISNATLIRLILWAEQHNSHYVAAAMRELQKRRKAEPQSHSGESNEMVEHYRLPSNSFTDAELEAMSHGDNPQANAYRELLAFRRNSPVIPDRSQEK
ncbi:hypothetical protein AU577_09095 [Salmonella enterica subsp. enterica serovar Alachua]|nr:hypothetical protein [Salmonella enterica subsp. enterica serovar Alachua]